MTLATLPQVFDLFKAGTISELTARAVASQTDTLNVDDRPIADAELAAKLPGMTRLQAKHAAARIVIGIDAEAAHTRATRNRADAHVSLFPAVDGVATMHVRGPAEQLLAAYNTLDKWAQGLRATGDTRTRVQLMCHTLIERDPRRRQYDGPIAAHLRTRDRYCRQPGWNLTTNGKTITWHTPPGHQYHSKPPPLLPRDRPRPTAVHLRQ